MFEKILAPTDFSAPAELALRHARALAERHGSSIELLTAVHGSEIWLADGPIPVPGDYLADAQRQALRDLEGLAAPLHAKGIDTGCRVVEDRPESAIRSAALEIGADLIVMGTHGRTGIAHAVMGSVAERALREAPCPVLTIRGDGPEPRPVRTIAAATDFSADAGHALGWAGELAESCGADLVLVHAVSMPFGVGALEVAVPDPAQSAAEAAAREALEQQRGELGDLVSELVVDSGPADAIILSAARRFSCDLIVVGSRGRTGLAHVVLGSTAERVVRTAPIPVATVKLP